MRVADKKPMDKKTVGTKANTTISQGEELLEILNSIVNTTLDAIDSIVDKLPPRVSLDDFSEIISEFIDRIILNTMRNEKLNYIGGTCKFTVDNKMLVVSVELYFQNSEQKWIKKSVQNSIKLDKFKPDTIEDLIKEKEITFEIDQPQA